MDKIILYTLPTCPKCSILKKKMQLLNIEYTLIEDSQVVLEFLKENKLPSEVPVLYIEGFAPMNFTQAWGWLSRQEETNG